MKTIAIVALLLQGYVTVALAQEVCTVPAGEFNGSLDISKVTGLMVGPQAGATLKIVSTVPPVAEFRLQTLRGCAGSFKSVPNQGACEGSTMKLVIDRSSASTEDCRSSVLLHLRVENGKLVGRFGKPAIDSGFDNLKF